MTRLTITLLAVLLPSISMNMETLTPRSAGTVIRTLNKLLLLALMVGVGVGCSQSQSISSSSTGSDEGSGSSSAVQPELPVIAFSSIPERSWSMGTYEVTQGQWKAVMGTEPWKGQPNVQEGNDYPALNVSWWDVQAFIGKLNALDSSSIYRLPTEAEWEYACRAGSTTAYSFGDDASELSDYAWYRENASDGDEKYAHQVGGKKPNDWDLYDMHGNVWEWVEDQWDDSGSNRVLRSGGFYGNAGSVRSAYRLSLAPGFRSLDLGFRLLRTALLDPTPAQAQVNEQDALAHDNAIDGPDRVSLNAKIAFVSLFGDDGKPGGDMAIYVINPDGSNATRLASGGGPTWSPDGTKIVFVSPGDGSNAEIYVINADGSSLTNLTNHPATEGAPSWSPDGTKIAFLSNRDGQFGLYSMNPDGSDQTRLTKEARDSSYPIWSPDGTKIAYTLGNAIYVTGADGSNATRLATGNELTWSPDGTKIAFSSAPNIYVMNADGSNQTRLGSQFAFMIHPAWSPDGTKIAFVEIVSDALTISVMNADGSNQTRLGGQFVFTMDGRFHNLLRLTWSPDGSTLAFTGTENILDPKQSWDIYTVDLDGKLTQLTTHAGRHMYVNPVWSPLLK